jgi:succinyl-CoA synthetase beta subunit
MEMQTRNKRSQEKVFKRPLEWKSNLKILCSVLFCFVLAASTIAEASDTYSIDKGRSMIGFGVHQFLGVTKGKVTRFTGTNREKGLEQLRKTALEGYYLEPFAKLLLAVAALRDKQPEKARDILSDLHKRFPDNELYSVELNRLATQ